MTPVGAVVVAVTALSRASGGVATGCNAACGVESAAATLVVLILLLRLRRKVRERWRREAFAGSPRAIGLIALVALAATTAAADKPAPSARLAFEPAKAELDDQAREQLDRAAAWLKTNRDAILVIEADSENIGYLDADRQLLSARARAIRDDLIESGIGADRIRMPLDEGVEGDARRPRYRIRVRSREPDGEPRGPPPRTTAPMPKAVTEYVYVETTEIEPTPMPLRYALSAGGGLVSSIEDNVTNLGGTWNVRLTAGTRHTLGADIAYVGSAQPISDSMGVGDGATLIGNGVEGALRVALYRESSLRPYGFAGAGLIRFDVLDATTDMDSDYVAFFPVGLGLSYRAGPVFFDLRGTARIAFDDELFDQRGGGELDNMSLSLQIGAEL